MRVSDLQSDSDLDRTVFAILVMFHFTLSSVSSFSPGISYKEDAWNTYLWSPFQMSQTQLHLGASSIRHFKSPVLIWARWLPFTQKSYSWWTFFVGWHSALRLQIPFIELYSKLQQVDVLSQWLAHESIVDIEERLFMEPIPGTSPAT